MSQSHEGHLDRGSGLMGADTDLLTQGNSIVGADRICINTQDTEESGIESLVARIANVRGGNRPEAVDVAGPLSRWPGPSQREGVDGAPDRRMESPA